MDINTMIDRLKAYRKKYGNLDVCMEHSSEYHDAEERMTTISESQLRIEDYSDAPHPFKLIIVQGG